jgi:hypothetical protein
MKTKIWLLVGKVKGVCMSEWMGALAVDGATRSNYLVSTQRPCPDYGMSRRIGVPFLLT